MFSPTWLCVVAWSYSIGSVDSQRAAGYSRVLSKRVKACSFGGVGSIYSSLEACMLSCHKMQVLSAQCSSPVWLSESVVNIGRSARAKIGMKCPSCFLLAQCGQVCRVGGVTDTERGGPYSACRKGGLVETGATLLGTSATLVVTGALLVVTRSY